MKKPNYCAHLHAFPYPHWRETKRKQQESAACFLIVSDCLASFSQTVPSNQSGRLCTKLGQSRSQVAMVRDCLRPVMPLAMWAHAHIAERSFVWAPLGSAHPLPPTLWAPAAFLKNVLWLHHAHELLTEFQVASAISIAVILFVALVGMKNLNDLSQEFNHYHRVC